jgi:glycosyltransferase involved in cell wall biosynthesis
MKKTVRPEDITIVCNPFNKIGRGVATVNLIRAMNQVYFSPKVCDIASKLNPNYDRQIEQEILPQISSHPSDKVNIFVINVDEIKPTVDRLGAIPRNAYNIIYPAWELSRCPLQWSQELEVFNELWAPSEFVKNAFSTVFSKPIFILPHPVEIKLKYLLNRDYFRLPNFPYLFLFFFDFRSFIDRKNPYAVIDAFEKAFKARPLKDMRLVIKINGEKSSDLAQKRFKELIERINSSKLNRKIILLEQTLDEIETKSLIRACDCFVSLHRSEGFGLGPAEAMFLGKPVIATYYSGNCDFMTSENSLPVDYRLIPVKEGQYPNWENQEWADPDIDQAAHLMIRLLDNSQLNEEIGRRASKSIRLQLSNIRVGFQAKERIQTIPG